ncbi:LysR family transcriptional regulator [Halocynthiibacter sp. C4]|uniref:LysR family transcriptional regulator n=1 Tax=Halocynthiibacter sp. C4 TaxID=2992758 RepID=UPI00237B6E23|nr:LysR family transcriptional regulator [Halocynthiibacter sp. C4]MDE0591206.1 LysR family transcriptional regulator [Halocynthiibacter sp. C4]
MDLLDQVRAFVATAQTGSFTSAADQLGVSNRLTSKYVAELEARLGVRLLQRTTRKVGLTPAGEDLLARAPALLDEFDTVLNEVSESSKGLSGTLRVSAPITFGEIYVVGVLARFAAQHPAISIDLRLNDRYLDLAAEGLDLTFRLGHFDQASLKVRRLGEFRSVLVASPDYLARHGAPSTPTELSNHACIVDTNRRNPRRWVLRKDGSEIVANVTGRFQVNSASAAVELATNGLGIAYVPNFALREAVKEGDLVTLLEKYQSESSPIGAVYLEGRTLPRKCRVALKIETRRFRRRVLPLIARFGCHGAFASRVPLRDVIDRG